MIKKLRVRFILAAMLSLAIVLAVIFGAVGALSYRSVTQNADSVLAVLKENGGTFPDSYMKPGGMGLGTDRGQKQGSAADSDTKAGKTPGSKIAGGRHFSAELPYETRYFTVALSKSGSVMSVNTGKIAAVDTEKAADYAKKAAESGKKSGYMDDYRYISYTSDGTTYLIFLDCGRDLGSFRSYLLTGIFVSLAGMIAVLLLLIVFSARVVRPFSENMEKQKRFITDAGHELKTPLTVISADAEVLEMDIGENEWLDDIKSQAGRMADLTNRLIQLSRMQEQPQIEMIEFPLSDLLEENLESFQALAKTHNETLTADIEPMLTMRGDEKSISQLITILLDNAVKYTDPGGQIKASLSKERNTIKLSVFNTAESVPRENVEHLFDRFYRMDQSRNSDTGGYGLGLSIAAAIVKAHKGKIAASTEDEKSLLITASFPV